MVNKNFQVSLVLEVFSEFDKAADRALDLSKRYPDATFLISEATFLSSEEVVYAREGRLSRSEKRGLYDEMFFSNDIPK